MANVFNTVGGNHPKLNRFDLSFTNCLSARIGRLYPVLVQDCIPGDVFKISNFAHIEVQPMVAPLMGDLTLFAHCFFVPYRLLYGIDTSDGENIYEKWFTGGEEGDLETPLPSWNPSWSNINEFNSGTIWDYVGNPVKKTNSGWSPLVPRDMYVSKAPKLAYNFIYNKMYRSEDFQNEVSLDNEFLLNATFKKDYFTSALEQQQRGIAPALPITLRGNIPITISDGIVTGNLSGKSIVRYADSVQTTGVGNTFGMVYNTPNYAANASGIADVGATYGAKFAGGNANIKPLYVDGAGITVNGTASGITASASASGIEATSFNVSQLRLATAMQRFMELSERSGYYFVDSIRAHYGTSPRDERLQRPEYIGGFTIPINVSTSVASVESASNPQGNKVGIASATSLNKVGNYRVVEPGLIMTMVSIRPKPIYKYGINRNWLKPTRLDVYTPELAYLSEQGIYNAELYVDPTLATQDEKDSDIFGYQAHWNEMRANNNIVTGAVREQLSYWTLARPMDSRPHLNGDFLEIKDEDFNYAFAVRNEDEFIINWSNIIDAYRPIPAVGVPGLMDHVYGGM